MKWGERISRFFFRTAWFNFDARVALYKVLDDDFKRAEQRDDFVGMLRAVLTMGRVDRL